MDGLGRRVYPVWGVKNGACLCGGIPGCRPGKHPYAKAVANGTKGATADPETLKQWFKGPAVNVGIAIDGFVVLDVEKAGMLLLAEWETAHGPLPKTPTVETGSGGRHFYFEEYVRINSLKPTSQEKFATGQAELLTGGGVIAPPSSHISGGQYSWLVPPETPLAAIPVWLEDLIVAHLQRSQGEKESVSEPDMTNPLEAVIGSSSGESFADLENLSSGCRFDRVQQVVGSMLRAGFTDEQILSQGEEWAGRQEPKYDANKIRETVRALARKEAVKATVAGVQLEEIFDEPPPKSETHKPPVKQSHSLPDAAYHGLFGEILKAVEPETEADPAGILLGMMTCFGNTVGRGAWFRVGPDPHYPALFLAVVSKTSGGKDTAWGVVRCLFREADPAWYDGCVCSGVGSGEGLLERIGDPPPGEPAIVPADKRCQLRLSEFSKCFKVGRRDGSTLSEYLREAWDGSRIQVPNRKANSLSADGYSVSVIGDITPGVIRKMLSGGTEGFDGFANCFLWCMVSSDRDLPHGGHPTPVLTPFYERLKAALAFAKTAGELTRDAEADSLWESVYGALKRSGDSVPHTERARPYVVRLAMIFALSDSSIKVKSDHIRAALAVWDHCRRSAEKLFHRTEEEKIAEKSAKLLNYARSRPEGITRTDAIHLFNRHRTADKLTQDFNELTTAGVGCWRGDRWFARENSSTGGLVGGGDSSADSSPAPLPTVRGPPNTDCEYENCENKRTGEQENCYSQSSQNSHSQSSKGSQSSHIRKQDEPGTDSPNSRIRKFAYTDKRETELKITNTQTPVRLSNSLPVPPAPTCAVVADCENCELETMTEDEFIRELEAFCDRVIAACRGN